MSFNLTIKALRDLRVQLGVSQAAIAHSMKIGKSVLGNWEREENMPESIHEGYERFLFDVLNGERKLNNRTQSRVWVRAKRQINQNSETTLERENKELKEARLKIKEYEALLGMYRKESSC